MNYLPQERPRRNLPRPIGHSQTAAPIDLATATIAFRFGLSVDHARLVAQLAGLGGKEAHHG